MSAVETSLDLGVLQELDFPLPCSMIYDCDARATWKLTQRHLDGSYCGTWYSCEMHKHYDEIYRRWKTDARCRPHSVPLPPVGEWTRL